MDNSTAYMNQLMGLDKAPLPKAYRPLATNDPAPPLMVVKANNPASPQAPSVEAGENATPLQQIAQSRTSTPVGERIAPVYIPKPDQKRRSEEKLKFGAVSDFEKNLLKRESSRGTNPRVNNDPAKGAYGNYQITRAARADVGIDPDKHLSADEQREVAVRYFLLTADQVKSHLGREPLDWEVYAGYQLGPYNGAKKFFSAPDNVSIENILTADTIKHNNLYLRNREGKILRPLTVREMKVVYMKDFGATTKTWNIYR